MVDSQQFVDVVLSQRLGDRLFEGVSPWIK